MPGTASAAVDGRTREATRAGGAAADRAERPATQVGEPARSLEPEAGHDGDVGREVRDAEIGRGVACGARLEPGKGHVPPGRARRKQPRGGGHVHEPLHAAAQSSREDARQLDLEPAGEDDVAAADDPGLQGRALESESDDQRTGRDGRRGRGIRRGRRACRRGGHHDGEQRRTRPQPHAISRTTSTGVPYVANAYISGASLAIIRMQPWEAG